MIVKPRIAIPTSTTSDQPYNQRSWPMYAAAVERSGGEAVEVRLGLPASEMQRIANTCHGVCLPGSPADVNPAYWGGEVDPATSPADPAREANDFFFLEDAEKHGKPVLAICYGMQSLNAWKGGTLVQDLTPVPVNHSAGAKVAVAHTVLVPEHSLLGVCLKATPKGREEISLPADDTNTPVEQRYLRLPVNTSHHQAVGVSGDGLRIVARCPEDGVIEAVEFGLEHVESPVRQFVLGVQWHPERSYDISAASREIFRRFVSEAAYWLEVGSKL